MSYNEVPWWKRIIVILLMPLVILLAIIEPFWTGIAAGSVLTIKQGLMTNYTELIELYTKDLWA